MTNFPILRLKISLPKNYPELQSPEVEVLSEFYKPFNVPKILQKMYLEQELAELETIYIWFDHCKSQLLPDLLEICAFNQPLQLDQI